MSRSTPIAVAIVAALPALVGTALRPARAETVTVYINRDGGVYTPGEPNDSLENVSSVPKRTVDIPAWEVGDDQWQSVFECVGDLFAPFDIAVTDADPGDEPHLEAVIGGDPVSLGLGPTVAGVSPFLSNCDIIDDSIVFVFPSVVGDDSRRLCETVAQEVAHSFGLDHQYLCGDPMTYLTGCGDKQFLFQESVCGEFEPRDCKCSRSQNSAQLLLDRVGRGDTPAIWLTQPSPGDVLAAGFPVQTAVTHAPEELEFYVDGVLIDAVEPDETGDPYQLIEFDTTAAMRSGSHHVELLARYGDGEAERSVTAVVEVEGVESNDVVGGLGCVAGRGSSSQLAGAVLAMLLALALGHRRARGRALPTAALALALLATQIGCRSTIFGGGPDDIESGCPGAGDVSPAIGALWSAAGGTCTATLVAPDRAITAAHCVADAAADSDPIVVLLAGRQYIGGQVVVHPDWQPGASDDDVAAVTLTRAVDGVEPLVPVPETPEDGSEFTIVGHGEWRPDDAREPERQAQVAAAADLEQLSFSYLAEGDDGCLAGRGGGPVVVPESPERVFGLHGEDRRIMRVDQYACWLACAAGPGVAANLPGGCDCARAQWRPCNDCGAEFLDFAAAEWSACLPAEDLRPCEGGLACDDQGYCVE